MKRTVLSLFIACCSLFAATAQTADYNVVPLPQEIRIENGAGFELSGKTVIAYNGDKTMKRNAQLLAQYIKESTGLESLEARLFHLEMWAFVHGIATMFATSYLDLPQELVSKMTTDCFQGLRKQYGME